MMLKLRKSKLLSLFLCILSSWLPMNHCRGTPLEDDGYLCNICRDSSEGERVLINPSKTFEQSNGKTVSCGELREWVQDVEPSEGTQEEALYCQLTQYLAWLNCDCVGPEIPSPMDSAVDLNPVCNICGAPGLDFHFVPQPNKNKVSDTGCCGRQNCEILYYGASQGVLSASMCTIVQQSSGSDCCNLDIIESPYINNTGDDDGDKDKDDNHEEIEIENNEEINQEDENQVNEIHNENDLDDESDCQDDPSFRFKGKNKKDCEWLASKRFKKQFCKRKSFGEKVWRFCPNTCGKCHRVNNANKQR